MVTAITAHMATTTNIRHPRFTPTPYQKNQNSRMKNHLPLTPDAPTLSLSHASTHLTMLSDGRSGLRSTMHVEIHDVTDPRPPSHEERAGERGRDNSPGDNSGSPLPAYGRGVRGEGSVSGPSTPDTPPSSILDFISSDETLDRYSEIISASGWKLTSYHR